MYYVIYCDNEKGVLCYTKKKHWKKYRRVRFVAAGKLNARDWLKAIHHVRRLNQCVAGVAIEQ